MFHFIFLLLLLLIGIYTTNLVFWFFFCFFSFNHTSLKSAVLHKNGQHACKKPNYTSASVFKIQPTGQGDKQQAKCANVKKLGISDDTDSFRNEQVPKLNCKTANCRKAKIAFRIIIFVYHHTVESRRPHEQAKSEQTCEQTSKELTNQPIDRIASQAYQAKR